MWLATPLKAISNKKGFTLVELKVVTAILGLLATFGIGFYSNSMASARDAKRKADLKEIQTALEQYYIKYGTYIVAGSGYSGCSCGWFGYEDGGIYSLSVSRGLYNEGFLVKPIVEDPRGGPSYMIYHNGSGGYSLYATLEKPTSADSNSVASSVAPSVQQTYGKNYAITKR